MLFLDFDGTLVSITGRPQDARLDSKAKAALKALSRLARYKLAIISGRSLNDLKRRVGLKGVIYSGNHGLEFEGPKIKFCVTLPRNYRKLLGRLVQMLRRKLSGRKGILIEDKGLSLSVHYRLAAKRDSADIKTRFHEAVIMALVNGSIEIKTGKKILEIRPAVKWDKGSAVLWLLARQKGFLPVYLGDDVTDEDVFRVLRNKGMTIFVGKPRPGFSAQYYLRGNTEVKEFLQRLIKLEG